MIKKRENKRTNRTQIYLRNINQTRCVGEWRVIGKLIANYSKLQ